MSPEYKCAIQQCEEKHEVVPEGEKLIWLMGQDHKTLLDKEPVEKKPLDLRLPQWSFDITRFKR